MANGEYIMTMHRLFPPFNTNSSAIIVNGRTYNPSLGTAIDAPDFDSQPLQANNWTYVAVSGSTASRPSGSLGAAPAARGGHYFDITLGYVIVYDGATWRNPANGNAV
jgi:hypothetical protein